MAADAAPPASSAPADHPLAAVGGGIGLGYRREVAVMVAERPDLAFTEVIAESVGATTAAVPHHLAAFLRGGRPCIPHGVKLGLGGADRPDVGRVRRLATAAETLGAPLASEHLAFVRAGRGRRRVEIGHLTPLPRTREMLAVVCANVRIVQDQLPVPLAVEHAAAVFEWPGNEMSEADFVTEVLDRTDAWLVLDLANVVVNAANHGWSPATFLDAIPMARVAYVHVAGGEERDGLRHDTHAHPVWPECLALVQEVASRAPWVPVLLERDDHFPPAAELGAELDALTAAHRHGCASIQPRRSDHARSTPTPPTRRTATTAATDAVTPATATVTDAVTDPVRQRLAADQEALARALVGTGPVPPGFDPAALAAASEALRHKRAGEVAARFPALAHSLGEEFVSRFVAYAATTPPPPTGGTRADGLAFARTLRRNGRGGPGPAVRLSPQARAEIRRKPVRAAFRGSRGDQGTSRAIRSSRVSRRTTTRATPSATNTTAGRVTLL